jgi:hypothetical protein
MVARRDAMHYPLPELTGEADAMSDEELREVDHSRRQLVKKLLAGAAVEPVIASFGLNTVAGAAKAVFINPNQFNPNQFNPKALKKQIKKLAEDLEHLRPNQTFPIP